MLNRLGICRSAVRHCTKKWSDLRRKSSKLGLGSLLDRCEKHHKERVPSLARRRFGCNWRLPEWMLSHWNGEVCCCDGPM
jgi:hypothetical protein